MATQAASAASAAPAAGVRSRPSRDALEKAALVARREGHVRYDPEQIAQPLRTDTKAAMHQPDSKRYITDVAGEERLKRQAAAAKEQARLASLREAALARDEKRWGRMAAESAADERKIATKRSSGLAAKKNAPSLPFNPITLQYGTGYDGGLLQHQDEMVKYRSALRTNNLYSKSNGDYNPISGAPRLELKPPAKPQLPAELQQRQQQQQQQRQSQPQQSL